MSYAEYRDEIKTGDVFFTAEKAWFSRLIRLFTRSKVSHVGMFLRIGGRVFTVEAVYGKGVVIEPASDRVINYIGSIKHYRSSEDITRELFKKIGMEYDLIGALISKFYTTKNAKYFCSELVEEVLNIECEATKRGTTPDDIARKCFTLIKI